jgi:uncharacterized membrane protein
MRQGLYLLILFFSACTLPEEKNAELLAKDDLQDSSSMRSDASYNAEKTDNTPSLKLPVKPAIKKPQGIYRATLPFNGKMEQTVAFYNDLTYQLQEKYINGKKDSIVVTQGNWSPSDGYIWLYKDQVVRGRYTWKGDILQYFSPLTKKNFAMEQVPDVMSNDIWKKRKDQGLALSAVGNEPFWNVQITKQDSISLMMPEWNKPLTLKISDAKSTADSTTYFAKNDSTQLRLTVLPYFCSDGMSDFLYSNKVRVQYNNQVLNGCGVAFR